MNIITILEVVLLLIATLMFLTQVFVPAIRGTALFPLFRKEGALQKQLAEVHQQQREKELANAVAEAQSKLEDTQK